MPQSLLKQTYLWCLDECVPQGICVHYVHAVLIEDQKRVSNSLDMDLQEVVSHVMWLLGTKSRSSARSTTTLNCRTISTVSHYLFLKHHFYGLNTKMQEWGRRGRTSKRLLGHDGSAFMNGSLMKNELTLPLLHLLPLPSFSLVLPSFIMMIHQESSCQK